MRSLGALAGLLKDSDSFSNVVPLIPALVCLSGSLRLEGVVRDSSLCPWLVFVGLFWCFSGEGCSRINWEVYLV